MHFKAFFISAMVSNFFCNLSLQAETRRIITYIDEVQEERKSTRWTLTEWLKTKERMKLMDVWLAMFSDPKKNKFAPELSLEYGQSKGLSLFKYGDAAQFSETKVENESADKKEQGHLQFWFTNLVSSTTGLRTLSIDLGLEAGFQNRFMVLNQTLAPDGLPELTTSTEKTQLAGVTLRIFGANEQDSYLVAKGGKFTRDSGLSLTPFDSLSGSYAGGEMALYFLPWLGARGQYLAYKPEEGKGKGIDYGGFLEVYTLRIGYGLYQNFWSLETDGVRLDTKETGRTLTVGLFF